MPLLLYGRHNMRYICLICLDLVAFLKLSSSSPTFCCYFATASQDETAKNYLQLLLCIKKCKHIPSALGIIRFIFANIHRKEMLCAGPFLEMRISRSTRAEAAPRLKGSWGEARGRAHEASVLGEQEEALTKSCSQ